SIHLLYLLLVLMLLGACVPAASTPVAEPIAEPTTSTAADPDAFPVTIDHQFGSTTIEAEPQRVISLGYGDEDAILALEIQPIAVRHWFGAPENGVWPWGQAALGDAKPQILEMGFGELNFEQITLLQPDLIVAIGAGLAAEEYATLSKLAPVIVTPAGYNTQMPWQEQLRLVGQATGRTVRAETVISDVEAQIATVRTDHPEFEGKSVAIAEYLEPGSYYIFDADNVRYRVLNALGFVMPEAVQAMQRDSDFNGTISAERLDLLEADLLIWGVADTAQQQELEASPLYQNLQVVAKNHDLFFTYNEEPNLISAAHAYGTALSIPYLLENLVPEISAVLGSAPATAATNEDTCDAGFRYFDHALLATDPVCIPNQPERFTYLIYPSYIYALGVKPVAAWGLERDAENYPFIFINSRRGRVKLQVIPEPESTWDSPQAVFESALAHEQKVTVAINKLVQLARQEGDFATDSFLKWFVDEQVEEEEIVDDVLQKLKLIGDFKPGLYLLDQELAASAVSLAAAAAATPAV
ncbi:MAG: ABC transporter substrate-binding protein, partial [Caldilineaceae bacterium]|nr:ABC transporter substrate-binding protein [Caldilineaceae bacterium]